MPNSAFSVLIIKTAFARHAACIRLAAMPGPDFTNAATINSILTFIPGVLLGFLGFLVFGTTSHFREIYTESIRHYCCCACISARWQNRWRRSRGNASSSSSFVGDRDVEDGRSWQALGNGRGRVPTYHCQVESGAVGEVELRTIGGGGGGGGGFARFGKKETVVRTTEMSLSSPAKAKQPWKTLGIDPAEGREH